MTEDVPTASSDYARQLRGAAAMLDMTNQKIRLHAGELSPNEMRAVQAVLAWKRREILASVEQPALGRGA